MREQGVSPGRQLDSIPGWLGMEGDAPWTVGGDKFYVESDARSHTILFSSSKMQDEAREAELNTKRAEGQSLRENMARNMENAMLSEGKDMVIRASGKFGTTLRIKYIFCGRPMMHQLINNRELVSNLREAGFEKVTCYDGYDDSHSKDL